MGAWRIQLLIAGAVLFAAEQFVRAQAGCTTDRAVISAQRGIIFEDASVAPGQWYWKLVDAAWCLPEQNGFRINIFLRARDAAGNLTTNQSIRIGYPHTYPNLPPNQLTVSTKAPPDWGDYPMAGSNWCPFWPSGPRGPYAAWVVDACPANGTSCPPQASYPSDRVWGMGLPCNQHESYYLTWQFTQAPPPPEPLIQLTPTELQREISMGQDLEDDTFTIENAGGGTLEFVVTEGVNWVSVSPASGDANGGEARTITIEYATAVLPIGLHHATISVSGNAANSPQTLALTLEVHSPQYRADFDADLDVDMEDFGFLQICLSGEGVPQPLASCALARLDADEDVDGHDLALFLPCLSGPEQTPPAICLE